MRRSIYRRFRRNQIVSMLAIALSPLLVLTGIIFYEFPRAYRNKVEEQIKYRARTHAHAIDVFLSERSAILTSIAELNSLDRLVTGDYLNTVLRVMNRSTGGFVDLGVIDSRGQHLAYVGPYELRGLNYYHQPWFAEVMSKGIYVSDVYMGYRQMPHFIIAVRRTENSQSWILRATIDSDIFNLLVREAKVGVTGDAFIINSEGMFQTTPRFDAKVLMESGLEPTMFGQGAVIEVRADDGRARLCAGSWLGIKDWLLVIQQDAGEGMQGFFRTRYTWLVYLALACIAIIGAVLITTRLGVNSLATVSKRQEEIDAQLLQNDKMAALGKMAAGIAHEINNPLAVIGEKTGWMMDLLEEEEFRGSPNFEEYKASLQKIDRHVERARKITLNMLSYARKMEPRLESVNVNNVVEKTVDFLGNIIRINNVRIEMNLDPGLQVIASDQAKLQQVFLNIISNAIDASGEGGKISIETRQSAGTISAAITDDGPGIPKNLQKRIFEPFFTTKEVGRGTGLGLWICFNIVENLGGSLDVSSEIGLGATFTVNLPITLPEKI